MSNLSLTLACGPYDRTAALERGEVAVEGVDLNYIAIQAPREIFDRMIEGHEFDASEISSSQYIWMMGRGDCPFVAIPVFPSKAFRHSFIYINKDAGIRSPKDLAGKRVGVPIFTQSAAVWIRGHLQHDYGVDLSSIRWVEGAVERAGAHGGMSWEVLFQRPTCEQAPRDRSLTDMLEAGELDAVLGSRGPDRPSQYPHIARLFPNYREVERDYFQRTGIHPIMHMVAIKRDIHEANPWLARNLYKAFEESKRIALDHMRYSGAQFYMLPWLADEIDEIDELFEGGDPWPYGIEPNRKTLEALVQYMADQHFIREAMPIEDLYVPVD